jgi:hypothetical protein
MIPLRHNSWESWCREPAGLGKIYQYDELMAAKSIFYGLKQASAAALDADG